MVAHDTLVCMQIAYMISGMIYFMWSLHCGFIIPEPSYPGWWIWLCVKPSDLQARAAVACGVMLLEMQRLPAV